MPQNSSRQSRRISRALARAQKRETDRQHEMGLRDLRFIELIEARGSIPMREMHQLIGPSASARASVRRLLRAKYLRRRRLANEQTESGNAVLHYLIAAKGAAAAQALRDGARKQARSLDDTLWDEAAPPTPDRPAPSTSEN